MSGQFRGRVVAYRPSGGGIRGWTSIYELRLDDGRALCCDYVEIASDGFRTLREGEAVWCSVSPDDPQWAVYVIPVRSFSPRELLGLRDRDDDDGETQALDELWL